MGAVCPLCPGIKGAAPRRRGKGWARALEGARTEVGVMVWGERAEFSKPGRENPNSSFGFFRVWRWQKEQL